MQKSIVKDKLSRGESVLVAKAGFMDPNIVEIFGNIGFDCAWLCNEHLGVDSSRMASLIRAGRASGIDCVVRTGPDSRDDFIRFLEMGANGLMIPHVINADQAKGIVERIKFPPEGKRGADGVNADAKFGLIEFDVYLRDANKETFVVLQIEDKEAVDNIEEIAAVRDVDVVFVGPGDLSISMGIPGQIKHKRIQEVIKRVCKACEKTGAVCGTTAREPEYALELKEWGVRYFSGISDWGHLVGGLKQTKEKFKEYGFGFNEKED